MRLDIAAVKGEGERDIGARDRLAMISGYGS